MGGLFGDPWKPDAAAEGLLRTEGITQPGSDQQLSEPEAIIAYIDAQIAILSAQEASKDLLISIIDLPLADPAEPLLRWRLTRAIDFTGSGPGTADAEVGAASPSDLRLVKNGSANGTIAFTGTGGVISFTNSSYADGDLFELYPPSSLDPTLDRLSITFETTA